MAATARHQAELKKKAELAIKTTTDPIELLRAKCLARGANGIRGLSRMFQIFDDNRDRKLDMDEFRKGINDYGFAYSKDETKDLFNAFDKDHSGSLDFDEFLEKLRVKLKIFFVIL